MKKSSTSKKSSERSKQPPVEVADATKANDESLELNEEPSDLEGVPASLQKKSGDPDKESKDLTTDSAISDEDSDESDKESGVLGKESTKLDEESTEELDEEVSVSDDELLATGETDDETDEPAEVTSLQDVFIDQLRDIYSAETQITKALPAMAEAATSPDLRKGFEFHLEQTKEHVARIEQICQRLEVSPGGKKCAATAGLVEEGEETMEESATPELMDVMLIGAARRVEHYEIAAYTGACDLARVLEMPEALKLLSETLSEEVATDHTLAKAGVTALATAHASEE